MPPSGSPTLRKGSGREARQAADVDLERSKPEALQCPQVSVEGCRAVVVGVGRRSGRKATQGQGDVGLPAVAVEQEAVQVMGGDSHCLADCLRVHVQGPQGM